jgi:alanine-synthesizing transaminase
VYSSEVLQQLVDLARKHQLLLLADEIYDKILYDDASHVPMASVAPDVLTLTFNGLSKAYRVCGYRAGWLVVTGPKENARDYLEGITLLASMRLCPNVPAQNAIQVALGGYQSIKELILPGGRLLEQRNKAYDMLNAIPGVSTQQARGALYLFPKLDPEVFHIRDDEKFVLDLLREQKILVSHGRAFNWVRPDHFRMVTLPNVKDIEEAIGRMGDFLSRYQGN